MAYVDDKFTILAPFAFFKFMTRNFLNKHAPKEWEQWVDEEREYWDNNKEN